MLDCVNVVKRYGGKFAVNGMSVAIEDAHIYGLLGPNGSGTDDEEDDADE